MGLRLDDTGFGGIRIFQQPEEFCYGVDAVMLAGMAAESSAASKEDCRIIDLGTGTGIIPLILSHKTKASCIRGVEIQENSWQLAVKNAAYNGLTDRVQFFHGDVKAFSGEPAETFDIVTSNPPYTEGNRGIACANRAKHIARHETTASLNDFAETAARLLKDKGDFYMVHRPARLADICECCRKHRLEPKEMCFVSGKPGEKPNILLIHCVKNGKKELRIREPIFVHEENGSYSQEILKMYEKV